MDAEQMRAVDRMQAYLEENVCRPVTLQSLARAVGYSPSHCLRLFEAATGRTPLSYLRALRLSQAALRLRDGGQSVLTVALDFEFGSHEGFTRAFTRQFGLSPRRYRQSTPPLPLFRPDRVLPVLLRKEKGESAMTTKPLPIFIQIVERPARKALILRGIQAEDYWSFCQERGCEIWGLLESVREALHEPVGLWLPPQMVPAGTSRYAAGVEVPADYANEVPQGLALIDLPPCQMMLFQGPPYDEKDMDEAIDAVWNAIAQYDPATVGYAFAPELGPRMQFSPIGERGYIELRPVKPLAQ